jgi:hypothetical protein
MHANPCEQLRIAFATVCKTLKTCAKSLPQLEIRYFYSAQHSARCSLRLVANSVTSQTLRLVYVLQSCHSDGRSASDSLPFDPSVGTGIGLKSYLRLSTLVVTSFSITLSDASTHFRPASKTG